MAAEHAPCIADVMRQSIGCADAAFVSTRLFRLLDAAKIDARLSGAARRVIGMPLGFALEVERDFLVHFALEAPAPEQRPQAILQLRPHVRYPRSSTCSMAPARCRHASV